MRFRAKFMVAEVTPTNIVEDKVASETVFLRNVSALPFGPQGESEDNEFARWTPWGEYRYHVTNPALLGTLRPGMIVRATFEVEEPATVAEAQPTDAAPDAPAAS